MTLNVKAPTGLGASAEIRLHEVWETLDAVQANVMKEGFAYIPRPTFSSPSLSMRILEDCNSAQYNITVMQLSAWRTYAQYQMNTILAGLLECSNEMDLLATDIRRRIRKEAGDNKEKKPSEAVIEDEVKANPRYRELLWKKQQLEQHKLLIEPYIEQYGREGRIMSRSLEGKKLELELSGKAGGPMGPRRGGI